MLQEGVKYAKQFALLGSVLVIGLLITWAATREAVRMAEAEAESAFVGHAELYIERIQNRLSNGLTAAQDLDNYYRASERMDEATFQRLVSADTHFRENAKLVGVVWQLAPGRQNRFAEAMNFLYGTTHNFVEQEPATASEAVIEFPLIYLWAPESFEKKNFLGKDLTEDTAIRAFIAETVRVGKPSAIIMPTVTDLGLEPTQYIMAANPAVSIGGNGFVIVQIVSLDALIASAYGTDLLNGDDFTLKLVSHWGENENEALTSDAAASESEGILVEKGIDVGAAHWVFTVAPTPGTIDVDYKAAIVTASVSMLLTGLFVFIFFSQSQRADRIGAIVKRRTRALKEAHEELEDHYRLLQKMNRDVEEAKSVAELANRTKSEFLATMSHELRTPLNAILGFSQLLSEQALGDIGDPRYVEYSKDIHASGSHLLSLINDILDLAKLEAGQVKIERNPVYVVPLVEKVINILSQQASDKGIELYSEFSDTLPDCIVGDELRLRQILINLCSNAIKFTTEGSVVARLHAKRFKNGNPGWVLEVQDTGIGIPEDKQATLFDRFTQVDAALSRRHGGVGLGLAICRELVDRMEGNISVRSIPTIGTTIRVHLPLEESTADDLEDDDQLI